MEVRPCVHVGQLAEGHPQNSQNYCTNTTLKMTSLFCSFLSWEPLSKSFNQLDASKMDSFYRENKFLLFVLP